MSVENEFHTCARRPRNWGMPVDNLDDHAPKNCLVFRDYLYDLEKCVKIDKNKYAWYETFINQDVPNDLDDEWINSFILELFDGDNEKASIFQKIISYLLNGKMKNKKQNELPFEYIVFMGDEFSGKSIFLKSFLDVLNNYVWYAPQKEFKYPSNEYLSLLETTANKRIVFKKGIIPESIMIDIRKEFIVTRKIFNPYKQSTNRYYVIMDSELPTEYKYTPLKFGGIYIRFTKIFERKQFKKMRKQLDNHKDDFIKWLIQGARKYNQEGISPEEFRKIHDDTYTSKYNK